MSADANGSTEPEPEQKTPIELLQWKAAPHGTHLLATDGTQLLHSDTFNVFKAESREKFISELGAKLAHKPEREREGFIAKARQQLEQIVIQVVKAKEKPAAAAGDAGMQGTAIAFEKVEPWSEPVDGAALFNELRALFERYIVLPTYASVALALWVVHTWCFELFDYTIRLGVTSPVKRCGKSNVLSILAQLVTRPLSTDNVSAASFYRVVQAHRPTLLADEADTYLPENEQLRGVLNSGHKRGGSAIRCAGDDSEARQFSTFAPVVIAAIGKLPGTIEDRAIPIELRRRKKTEQVGKLRSKKLAAETLPLRQKIVRWIADHKAMLADADPVIPDVLNDRAADGWEALLALAGEAGGSWPDLARQAATALCGDQDAAEDSTNVRLLADIRAVFEREDADRMASKVMVEKLKGLEESPWPTWNRGRGLDQNALAKLLVPFGVKSRNVRLADGSTPKGYRLEQFRDTFERYLSAAPEPGGGSPAATPPQPSNDGPSRPIDSRHTTSPVAAPNRPASQQPSGLWRGGGSEASPEGHDTTPDAEPGADDILSKLDQDDKLDKDTGT